MRDAGLVRQAYRSALDPTAEQAALLSSFTGASRFWFNAGLALVKQRLDAHARGEDVRVPWSYHQLCSEFKGDAIKDQLAPWRHEVVVGSYQAGLEALGRALQNFSKRREQGRSVGFPRFRAKGRCREASYSSAHASTMPGEASSTAGSARSAPGNGCRSSSACWRATSRRA